MLPIRVSGPRQAESLTEAICAAVRATDAGGSDVRVRIVGPMTAPRTASGVLREALELDVGDPADRRRDIEVIGRLLSMCPFVIICDATSWAGSAALGALESLTAIGSSARKLVQGANLTVLVLNHEPLWAVGDELGLDTGWPTPSFGDVMTSPETVIWAAYVHHRIAWEAGGDLDRALGWSDALSEASLRSGDDDMLEARLNALSTAEWSMVAAPLRSALSSFLQASPSDVARPRRRQELEQERAFWCSGGVTRIVPWMARSLLQAEATPLLRAQLRWSLVCAPLRRDLLSRCLDIEAFARAEHARDYGEPPDAALGDWEGYRNREPGSDARFYPANSPATPDGPFSFVELGGFLAALRVSPSRIAVLHRLRMLRNYLAHGHYVSWGCVRDLMAVERAIRL